MKGGVQDKMEKDDDFILDEVRGGYGKKTRMSILNKKKLSSFEMDELFLEE